MAAPVTADRVAAALLRRRPVPSAEQHSDATDTIGWQQFAADTDLAQAAEMMGLAPEAAVTVIHVLMDQYDVLQRWRLPPEIVMAGHQWMKLAIDDPDARPDIVAGVAKNIGMWACIAQIDA